MKDVLCAALYIFAAELGLGFSFFLFVHLMLPRHVFYADTRTPTERTFDESCREKEDASDKEKVGGNKNKLLTRPRRRRGRFRG